MTIEKKTSGGRKPGVTTLLGQASVTHRGRPADLTLTQPQRYVAPPDTQGGMPEAPCQDRSHAGGHGRLTAGWEGGN